jgi:AcrR family transcriptional regulator
MGRPRVHDDRTRAALRAAAERLVARGGPRALSVRAVATEAGTTTRAVYSLFGSKEELLVEALAQGAFEFIADALDALPLTDDPLADLIAIGVPVFRSLVIEHPALYRIAFQRVVPGMQAGPELAAARGRAYAHLTQRVERVTRADKPTAQAALEFNAMLEGLANAELRGGALPILPAGEEERAWNEALTTVARGFSR